MQTVRLGRTNVQVSVAGLGCGGASRLGMARGADAHRTAGIVRRALDFGLSGALGDGIHQTVSEGLTAL